MKISGIYQIQSKRKPERIYIGSAVDINRRWNEHINSLRSNKHENKKLQNHCNKYGEVDLMFSILLGCEKEDLLKVEQYFLDTYKTYFNIRKDAHNCYGTTQPAELRKRRSKIMKMVWKKKGGMSKETRLKMSMAKRGKPSVAKGRKWSEESRAKMRGRQNALGYKRTEENKQMMRELAIQNKWKPPSNLGRTISKETREKIKRTLTGKILPFEHKKHISESLKGRIPWNKGLKNPEGVTGKIKKRA